MKMHSNIIINKKKYLQRRITFKIFFRWSIEF